VSDTVRDLPGNCATGRSPIGVLPVQPNKVLPGVVLLEASGVLRVGGGSRCSTSALRCCLMLPIARTVDRMLVFAAGVKGPLKTLSPPEAFLIEASMCVGP
jgi:hypothetical protein